MFSLVVLIQLILYNFTVCDEWDLFCGLCSVEENKNALLSPFTVVPGKNLHKYQLSFEDIKAQQPNRKLWNKTSEVSGLDLSSADGTFIKYNRIVSGMDNLNRSTFGLKSDFGRDYLVHYVADYQINSIRLSDIFSHLKSDGVELSEDQIHAQFISDRDLVRANGLNNAFIYMNDLYILGSFDINLDGKKIPLSKFNKSTQAWSYINTTGASPNNSTGYSVSLYGTKVYLVGGVNTPDSQRNRIYQLDLVTKIWSVVSISGFVGADSGCLVVVKGILVHAFGLINGQPTSSTRQTQLVNTVNWHKLTEANLRTLNLTEDESLPQYIIIGIAFGGLVLLLVIIGFGIYIKRCNEKNTNASAPALVVKRRNIYRPEYFNEIIWIEPITWEKYVEDYGLLGLNSPEIYFDSDLKHS